MNTYTASVLHTLTEAGFLAEKIDNLWTLFSLTGDEKEAIMYSTTIGSLIRQAEIELGV